MTSNPLRIALVNTSDHGGGAEASTISLCRALQQLGHECKIYVGVKNTNNAWVHEISRFRPFPGLLRLVKSIEGMTGWQYLYQPWFSRLDRLIGNVDVVHYQSLWYGSHGYASVAALPRLTKRYPSLMTLRDMWMLTGHCACPALHCDRWKIGCGRCPDLTIAPAITSDGTRFNLIRKTRSIQRSQIRITTVSDWLAKEARQSPVFSGKQIHTVHNGIDERTFYVRDRQQMRRELGLPTNVFIALVAGQSVEGTSGTTASAPDYALDALLKSGVAPFLLAIGRSSSKMLARWPGQGLAVPFQDDPEQLAKYYSAADIVLVASLWETFGRIPAEAQMCGIPVAAFATGGIPEIVEHRRTGLIAERLNADALAEAVRWLYQNRDARLQMGSLAAANALAHFRNQSIAERFVEHYRAEIAERQLRTRSRS